MNPSHKQSNDFKNIHDIEDKLTRFQIYHETEFAPYATSHPINEGTAYVPVNLHKRTCNPGGKLTPYDSKSTRLQELSSMNNTYFGNIHYDIHLDMKLDYTISRIFQEMSLSELETLHQLCEL